MLSVGFWPIGCIGRQEDPEAQGRTGVGITDAAVDVEHGSTLAQREGGSRPQSPLKTFVAAR